jgi:hypothetical protein
LGIGWYPSQFGKTGIVLGPRTLESDDTAYGKIYGDLWLHSHHLVNGRDPSIGYSVELVLEGRGIVDVEEGKPFLVFL